MEKDEIIFSGAYKDFRLGVHYDITGKDPKDVAGILAHISAAIEHHSYRFSGIDTKKIDDFVRLDGRGISSVVAFLEKNSPAWNSLLKGLSNPLLKNAAESYLFNRLLTEAGVKFKVDANSTIKPEEEEIGDQIAFIGKFGSWISIKKLSLDKVKDYEVSAILGGINFSAVNKAFDFAGIEKDDDIVKSAAKGKRKSLSNAIDALKDIESKADNPYVVCKTLETLGFMPYASPHMLTNAYPDIKPPKVKGRKPKG